MVKPDCRRFQVWRVNLDPAEGNEIKKTRPCIVVSPDEIGALSTVIVAPMSTKGFEFPCRVKCRFRGKTGVIVLDQLSAVDRSRLIKSLGMIDKNTQREISRILQEMFTF